MSTLLLRRTFAALVLALFAMMALSGGVALADDDGASGREASRTAAPASQQSEPRARSRADSGVDSRADSGTGSRALLDADPEPRQRSEPEDSAELDDIDEATANRRSTRAVEDGSADQRVTPAPERAASPAVSRRSARAEVEHVGVAPGVAPAAPPVITPRLDRQLAGGFSDVGTIAVSVVHAAATAVAQAFGPDSFFGVPHLLATVVANTAAAVGRALVAGSSDAAAGPFPVTYGLLEGLALFRPTKPPAGANDPSITVTPERPLPVILLNSTVITQGANWSVGAPVLANAGYKVYTFNYGNVTRNPNALIQSIGDIRKSGLELAAEIDRVLVETGAPQVILIGHSQGGGALPSYYINNLGGADKVSQLIGIGPGHHGTTFMGLVSLVLKLPILRQLYIGISAALAPAFYQQSVGSPFLDEVYGDGDTRPGVRYTTISTAYDEVATPYTRQALDGPNVTNIVLQHRYPRLLLGHLNMVTSPHTWTVVLEALAADPAANPAPTPSAAAA